VTEPAAQRPVTGQALDIQPVTAARWADLAALFGPSGAFSNCWCTWWRQKGSDFSAGIEDRGAGNRALMESVVASGAEPGLIAYRAGRPVGWISVAPRPQFGRVLRSPVVRPPPEEADDSRTWSVVCFWMPRRERGRGVATALLDAAVDRARQQGARQVEGYPTDTDGGRRPAAGIFTGTLRMFLRAGFEEVERRRGDTVIVRRSV
jgi:GNAT superfamily N-acetyltransferase